jgi:hypothetical protein
VTTPNESKSLVVTSTVVVKPLKTKLLTPLSPLKSGTPLQPQSLKTRLKPLKPQPHKTKPLKPQPHKTKPLKPQPHKTQPLKLQPLKQQPPKQPPLRQQPDSQPPAAQIAVEACVPAPADSLRTGTHRAPTHSARIHVT